MIMKNIKNGNIGREGGRERGEVSGVRGRGEERERGRRRKGGGRAEAEAG